MLSPALTGDHSSLLSAPRTLLAAPDNVCDKVNVQLVERYAGGLGSDANGRHNRWVIGTKCRGHHEVVKSHVVPIHRGHWCSGVEHAESQVRWQTASLRLHGRLTTLRVRRHRGCCRSRSLGRKHFRFSGCLQGQLCSSATTATTNLLVRMVVLQQSHESHGHVAQFLLGVHEGTLQALHLRLQILNLLVRAARFAAQLVDEAAMCVEVLVTVNPVEVARATNFLEAVEVELAHEGLQLGRLEVLDQLLAEALGFVDHEAGAVAAPNNTVDIRVVDQRLELFDELRRGRVCVFVVSVGQVFVTNGGGGDGRDALERFDGHRHGLFRIHITFWVLDHGGHRYCRL